MYSLLPPTRIRPFSSRTVCNVWIRGSKIRNRLLDVRIIEAEANHEIAVARYVIPARTRLWALRTPVDIEWGRVPGTTQRFVGYIHHFVHEHSANRAEQIVQVVCIGASDPLKNQPLRSWHGVTDSYIASQIAKQYRLTPVVDASEIVWPVITQSGKSDFAFLAERAAKIGYRFYVRGTTLYFINPIRIFRWPRAQATPWFSLGTARGVHYSLHKFKPVIGEDVPDGGMLANRAVLGIDPRKQALVTSANEYLRYTSFQDDVGIAPKIEKYHTDHTIESVEEARIAMAAEAMNNRHWVSAQIETDGDARLQPLATVYLDGGGLNTDYHGLWMVRSTEHRLSPNRHVKGGWDYNAVSTIGRDQIYTLTEMPPAEWTAAKQEVDARLQSGLWVANHV